MKNISDGVLGKELKQPNDPKLSSLLREWRESFYWTDHKTPFGEWLSISMGDKTSHQSVSYYSEGYDEGHEAGYELAMKDHGLSKDDKSLKTRLREKAAYIAIYLVMCVAVYLMLLVVYDIVTDNRALVWLGFLLVPVAIVTIGAIILASMDLISWVVVGANDASDSISSLLAENRDSRRERDNGGTGEVGEEEQAS